MKPEDEPSLCSDNCEGRDGRPDVVEGEGGDSSPLEGVMVL